jgi:hypothetical protein
MTNNNSNNVLITATTTAIVVLLLSVLLGMISNSNPPTRKDREPFEKSNTMSSSTKASPFTTSQPTPVWFVSHGGPTIARSDPEYKDVIQYLRTLGKNVRK